MKDVEGKAEQQPFSSNLRIATKQKTPEIKILLHIRKVALSLNGTVHPKQVALRRRWIKNKSSLILRMSLTHLPVSGRIVVKSRTAGSVVWFHLIRVVSRKADIYRKNFTGPKLPF